MKQRYTHLFFDLDHTLWDTDRNAAESLQEMFEETELAKRGIPDFIRFHQTFREHNEQLWHLYAENKTDKETVRLHRFRQTLLDFGIEDEQLVHHLAELFVSRTPHKKHLLAGAIALLEQLSSIYHLSIITNGFREAQYTKMQASGLAPYFRQVIVSEEVGCHKPDPAIFQHAIHLTGAASAADCMMIGDTFNTDVQGALNAGVKAVHLCSDDTAPTHENVIRIGTLGELLTHL